MTLFFSSGILEEETKVSAERRPKRKDICSGFACPEIKG